MAATERTRTFDDLVSDLSSPERRSMLDRIARAAIEGTEGGPEWSANRTSGDLTEPSHGGPRARNARSHAQNRSVRAGRDAAGRAKGGAVVGEALELTGDLDRYYQRLGMWQKVVIFFRALFSGRDRYAVLQEDILRFLERRINGGGVALIDLRAHRLTPEFRSRLVAFAESVAELAAPVRFTAAGEKADFLLYLAGVEMPEFQDLLILRTDPLTVLESHPDFTDLEIRRRLEHDLDDLLSSIPGESRNRLYRDSRLLTVVERICNLRLERMISTFSDEGREEGGAQFSALDHDLRELSDALNGITAAPSVGFMKALFLFAAERGYLPGVAGGPELRRAGSVSLNPSDGSPDRFHSNAPNEKAGATAGLSEVQFPGPVGDAGASATAAGTGDSDSGPSDFESLLRSQPPEPGTDPAPPTGRESHEYRADYAESEERHSVAAAVTDPAELEQTMEAGMRRGLAAFEAIIQFARDCSLTAIVRCVSGDITYSPSEFTGGEDWLAEFKRYWKNRLEASFHRFSSARKREAFLADARLLCEGTPIIPLAREGTETWAVDRSGHARLTGIIALSCLRVFFETTFPVSIQRQFKQLLIDGQFYKNMNREEFTDALAQLSSARDRLRRIESGRANGDVVRGTVDAVNSALRTACNVVHGVLFGESGGRYDSISNRSEIGGRSNKQYLQDLEQALRKAQEAIRISTGLLDLDIM